MIFYFSATGNSLYAAKCIGARIGEQLVNISAAMRDNIQIDLLPDETVGFVFPLFAWSAPKMVLDFAKKVPTAGHYTFAVATFGQNIGRFDRFFEQAGIRLSSAFSLNMPNNYIVVWDKTRQDQCLTAADKRLETICDTIYRRQEIIDIQCVLNGKRVPEALTAFAPEMNSRWSSTVEDTSDFYVTEDCIGCGTCEKVCNGRTIRLREGKPVWGDNCTKCLACLHLCPGQAIQFGQYTVGAGRYRNPNIKLSELMINK